jgi:hypothetical protein
MIHLTIARTRCALRPGCRRVGGSHRRANAQRSVRRLAATRNGAE